MVKRQSRSTCHENKYIHFYTFPQLPRYRSNVAQKAIEVYHAKEDMTSNPSNMFWVSRKRYAGGKR